MTVRGSKLKLFSTIVGEVCGEGPTRRLVQSRRGQVLGSSGAGEEENLEMPTERRILSVLGCLERGEKRAVKGVRWDSGISLGLRLLVAGEAAWRFREAVYSLSWILLAVQIVFLRDLRKESLSKGYIASCCSSEAL